MPTRAELPRPSHLTYQDAYSWTDDLPVCRQSGVGYSTNQIYRDDGHRQEEHPYEDMFFHFRSSLHDATFLYGVFDGHDGDHVAKFALQRLAAEILLDPLAGKTSDEEIRDVLRQAFTAVEKSYMESIDDKLAERTSLQYEIPEGLNSYEAYQKYPHVVDKLKALNGELSSGTSSVVALVANGRLFVANVGDSRALLCRTDANNVLKVVQLSVDHDLSNEDELLRLYNLGLDIDKLTKGSRLGNEENTRCIGNFLVKGAYKEFEDLAIASTEPVIAEPEIHGGIQLDDSCRFLLLMSDGLYKSLQEARGTDQVNKEIAQMVDAEFRVQSTLTGVAQAVVDKIVRVHHDASMSCSGGSRCGGGKRDDITLLLRNFNYPLPHSATVRFDNNPQFNYIPANSSHSDLETQSSGTCTTRSDDTTSSEAYTSGFVRPERIPAYVDFSEFYRNVDMARQAGTLPPEIDF